MANFAKLDITFTSDSIINDVLSFSTTPGSDPSSLVVTETAKSLRQAPLQFTSGTTSAQSAQRYYDALVLDFGLYFNIIYTL